MKSLIALSLAMLIFPSYVAATTPANLYECSGVGVSVSYSTTSFSGEPLITFKIGKNSFSARGDEILVQHTALGNQVTIVKSSIPDLHTNTLTFLSPSVNVSDIGVSKNFTSWLFATRTRTTIGGPQFVEGLIQLNKSWTLSCKAKAVVF